MTWRGDGAALLAGLLLPFAYAPFDLFPTAVLAPALLLWTWLDCDWRRAALRGWLFGLGMFGFGISWINESFQFSHIGWFISIPLTSLLVAVMALYPALVGYCLARLGGGPRWMRLTLLFPALWTLVEWLRGWLFTGFTWLQLGYSQTDSPLSGWFPVFGVYAISCFCALSAGLLVGAYVARRRLGYIGVLLGLWLASPLLGQVNWLEPGAPPLRVALLQGNIPQDQKWLPSMRQPTLDRYVTLTREHWNADLIIWPETALPGFYRTMKGFIEEFDEERKRHQADVLLGVPVLEEAPRRFLNSVLLLNETGGFYHKRHLVPFGEYLPFDALLRPMVDFFGLPVARFSPGPSAQVPLSTRGQRLAVFVCYEIAFGGEVRRSLPAANLIITVSNDAWFGTSIGPEQHLQIARVRALETGRYVLRATNTGISAIIDQRGRVVSRSPQFEVHALAGQAIPFSGATPYVRLGDWPVLGMSLVVILVVMGMRRAAALGD